MRVFLIVFLFFCCLSCFGQTKAEQRLISLSSQIFKWEVSRQMDSLNIAFHEKLTVMGSNGNIQSRLQYIQRLTGNDFVHNAIDVNQSKAYVAGNTGVVMGSGKFTVTIKGQRVMLSLEYSEVFTRLADDQPWLLLAIHANPLPQ